MKTQIIRYLLTAAIYFVFGSMYGQHKASREANKKLDVSLETCHYELKQCRFMYKGE